MRRTMKIVKFLRDNPPYRAGEIAGFPDDVARELVEGRIADLEGVGPTDESMTVADMAERLARCTGHPVEYHARQLRHWAQRGVFDNLRLRGKGLTAAREFSEVHLARARLLAFLVGLGFGVDQLVKVVSFLSKLDFQDRDFASVVDATVFVVDEIKHNRPGRWRFQLKMLENGAPIDGFFTRDPKRTPDDGIALIVIPASAVLAPLFKAE